MENKRKNPPEDAPGDLFGFGECLHARKSQAGIMRQHYLFKFANGYGASFIQGEYSYGCDSGLWKLAVLKLYSGGRHELVYDIPIINGVTGLATEDKKTALRESRIWRRMLPGHKKF